MTHGDRHGAPIEIARLKAPLADGDERLFVQIGIETENHSGFLDSAVRPDDGLDDDLALDFRAHRSRRVLGLHHPNRPWHPHAGRALCDGVFRKIVIRNQGRRDPVAVVEAEVGWRRHLPLAGGVGGAGGTGGTGWLAAVVVVAAAPT